MEKVTNENRARILQELLEENDRAIDRERAWAVENACYGGDVETCDQCGKRICREMSRVWTDTLVICKDC